MFTRVKEWMFGPSRDLNDTPVSMQGQPITLNAIPTSREARLRTVTRMLALLDATDGAGVAQLESLRAEYQRRRTELELAGFTVPAERAGLQALLEQFRDG